jgi:selenide,water dikinase
VSHPDLLVGLETGDDAAVFRVSDDMALVQTVDFFPPIVDDPYWYGAIAAANAFSDVYAMGGRPVLALNIVGYPVDHDLNVLSEILHGGYDKAAEAGVLIAGGHTVDDREPKYGMAVTGLVKPGSHVTNAGARPGDVLVLTKPLGTGIITTAGKAEAAPTGVLDEAVRVMATLNRAASEAMLEVGVNACTDVTGFGLMGHLGGMATGSGVAVRIRLGAVPVLPGVRELLDDGLAPAGTYRNMKAADKLARWDPSLSLDDRLILCDAQTSGGLLFSVAQERVAALIRELEARSVLAAVVGDVLEAGEPFIEVLA